MGNKKDESWKGFKTFVGITLIVIHIVLSLARLYNASVSGYDYKLSWMIGFDGGSIGYLIGYNFLIIFGLLFLYLEDKKITNLMRYILLAIVIIIILSILGF